MRPRLAFGLSELTLVRGATPLVQRSSTAGNSHEVDATGLFPVFFGADGRKKLKSTEFQQFVRQLHDGIMELEFKSFDAKNTGTISAHDFAVSIVRSLARARRAPTHRDPCRRVLGAWRT